MAHQTACRYFGRVAYEGNFGGLAASEEEGDRLAGTAKSNKGVDVVFLANHGVIVGGQPLNIVSDDIAGQTAQQFADVFDLYATVHFDALKRVIGMTQNPPHT
jgi:hypothetical protein